MKAVHRADREVALALLRRAPVVHVASTTAEGEPILRTVHAAVLDDAWLAFHGSPAGEKAETLGRPAFVCAEETVATLPSYFIDAERACPATTYYLSAHVTGALEPVEDPHEKARVLMALMHKLQPEGGYVPIDADHPLYAKTVGSLLVVRVSLERLVGKAKLGQHRSTADVGRVVEGLWTRGAPGDDRAIERILAANPAVPLPSWLRGPAGVRLVVALDDREIEDAAALVEGEYWNEGVARERIARAMRASSALVGARDAQGRLVATARAVGDGTRHVLVADVCVAREWRGRGLGQAMVRLVLDHPAVRDADFVRLGTRDAQTLYARFGFVDVRELRGATVSTQMVRRREPAPAR
jgi:nitroimidazol reductase NimA-like FMN-containing flavoprotein (pyridoxamine 5'-phosphate oxidase superfamily)/ribosomal protein S18 acetylase RimI-like enzyme